MNASGKTQLNFRTPPQLALKVRTDALRNNKNLDDVGTAILADFFGSYTVAERAKIYSDKGNKKTGRKVASTQEKMGVKV